MNRRISNGSGTFKQVLSSPLYRGATIAMFLSGLGVSAAAPQIVLFLVKELGTPLPIAGLYYLTNLTAPIAGYLVGNHSDRTGERLILFRLCALAGFAGWAAIALSTTVWMPFLISSLVLAFSVAASSQLFAAVRDDLDQEAQGSSEGVVAIVRMALTAGWVIGPMVGAWLAAATSLRTMLWMTALCALAQIIPLGTLKGGQVRPPIATRPQWNVLPPSGWQTIRPLLAFTALYVLVYAGESVKYGFLPLYMDVQLHLEPAVRGAVIGIQPLVELAIMPFCVPLGRRVGFLWLMCIGAAFGVAANICFATTANALWHVRRSDPYGRCLGYFRLAWHHRCTAVASDCGRYRFCHLHELDGSRQRSGRSYWSSWRRHRRPPQNLLHPGGICFPCRIRPRGYGEIRNAEIEARRRSLKRHSSRERDGRSNVLVNRPI